MMKLFVTLIFLYSTNVFAQAAKPIKVKVIKAKKGKAVIRHSKKIKLKKGKMYRLSEGDTKLDVEIKSVEEGITAAEGERKHFIGLSLDAGLFKQKVTGGTDVDSKNFDINILYGWNFTNFELGPFVEYNFQTVGTNDSKKLLGGVFFDYNFSPNTIEAESIIGIRASAAFGSLDSSAQASATSVMRISPAVIIKWFGLNTSLGVVGMAGYQIDKAKIAGNSTTSSGLFGRIGIQSYY